MKYLLDILAAIQFSISCYLLITSASQAGMLDLASKENLEPTLWAIGGVFGMLFSCYVAYYGETHVNGEDCPR